MPRRRPADEPTRLEVLLPLTLRRRLDRKLYDRERRRVPYGLYSAYVLRLIEQDLK